MNVLIIGSGGREHALAWKTAQSPKAETVFVAPGNAGTAAENGKIRNVPVKETDFPALIRFVKEKNIGLTIVGPEVPLCEGIVDAFEAENLRIFGPNKAAAQLEGSKIFCKEILRKGNVPTAVYHTFSRGNDAIDFLNEDRDMPIVVKADGLAAGKGVFVCENRSMAIDAVKRITQNREFGSAGDRIVLEERLIGQEASVLAITDGKTIAVLPPAQDHKAAYDGDTGPNTGGMGAYSPAPVVDEKSLHWIEEYILVPTVHALNSGGTPFKGVLYAGLMMTKQGPKVLEYNVRFGDPECQPLLMRLKTDFIDICEAVIDNRLEEIGPLDWDERSAVCVVMASKGYPGNYEKGFPIRGLDEAAKIPNTKVFHAGTVLAAEHEQNSDGLPLTGGGRVLGVTGLGATVSEAKLAAYTAVKCIRWDGAWCRKDISDKAVP
ncbi:MAG: phosphoribosylamine--glycine ligase [Planctomycetaceae bacterium]|jgi:phosphoribosylamine--glycine ligase|nr:phosphoribosylamine--glycine ligase [Planctomycetaceae bacterium]